MRIAALDIGGTAIKFGVWDGTRLADAGQVPSVAREGGPALMKQMKDVLGNLAPFDAIGVSTANEVDPRTGRIVGVNRNIPDYAGTPVASILGDAFGVPVAVENDANAAALGELHYGAMQGETDFVFVSVGTGVGGALVMNRQLHRGHAFAAGSFAGIVVHPELLDPNDLLAGRYERFASATALVSRAQVVDAAIENGMEVFARREEPAIQQEILAWTREVAIGLVSLIYAFAPPAIVLGGGVMQHPGLAQFIGTEAKRLVPAALQDVRILPSQLANEAGVLGAAHLAERLLVASA